MKCSNTRMLCFSINIFGSSYLELSKTSKMVTLVDKKDISQPHNCHKFLLKISSLAHLSHYLLSLSSVSSVYNDSLQEANEACPNDMYFEQDEVEEKKVCQFKRSVLRQCSGLADSNFGYSEGQPCILVKMNRVSHCFYALPGQS